MGLELFLFFALSTGVGSYAQSVHEINKELVVPRATRITLGKLDYNRHEKYASVSFKQVVAKSKKDILAWRELRSQQDENGYWLDPGAM